MQSAHMLAYITDTIDQELPFRNEHLFVEKQHPGGPTTSPAEFFFSFNEPQRRFPVQ